MPPPAVSPSSTRITILLATYNGAGHLPQQLASYAAQSDANWDLWVSDDGSSDDTRALIDRFRTTHGQTRDIRLVEGPRQGHAANFMSLLTHPDLPAGAVALSDQDDVWLPHKLARARTALRDHDTRPVIYGAQSIHTDQNLTEIGRSRPPPRPPCFANALTQNIVSGHSTVLNAAALAMIRTAGAPTGIPYHDWWLYQFISGVGGTVVIDPEYVLRYRQHTTNAMGAHRGIASSLRRSAQILDRTYGDWIAANTKALMQVAPLLTPENHALLKTLHALPRHAGLSRARAFYRLGLHRQTPQATAALFAAAFLGRV